MEEEAQLRCRRHPAPRSILYLISQAPAILSAMQVVTHPLRLEALNRAPRHRSLVLVKGFSFNLWMSSKVHCSPPLAMDGHFKRASRYYPQPERWRAQATLSLLRNFNPKAVLRLTPFCSEKITLLSVDNNRGSLASRRQGVRERREAHDPTCTRYHGGHGVEISSFATMRPGQNTLHCVLRNLLLSSVA